MSELDEVAVAAAQAAAHVAMDYALRQKRDLRQVITIITMEADADDVDDTALASMGVPGGVSPEAVLDTLLGHVKQLAENLGGEIHIIGLGDIGNDL